MGSGVAGFGMGVSGLGVRVERALSKYSIFFFFSRRWALSWDATEFWIQGSKGSTGPHKFEFRPQD